MKRFLIIQALSVACLLSAQAQTRLADSLRTLVRTAPSDTSRSLLLAQLARTYMYSKPDSSLLLAEQGLRLAVVHHYPRGKAACLHQIGIVLSMTGNHAKAVKLELEALRIAEALQDRPLLLSVNNALGVITLPYYFSGSASTASEATFAASATALLTKSKTTFESWMAQCPRTASRA